MSSHLIQMLVELTWCVRFLNKRNNLIHQWRKSLDPKPNFVISVVSFLHFIMSFVSLLILG